MSDERVASRVRAPRARSARKISRPAAPVFRTSRPCAVRSGADPPSAASPGAGSRSRGCRGRHSRRPPGACAGDPDAVDVARVVGRVEARGDRGPAPEARRQRRLGPVEEPARGHLVDVVVRLPGSRTGTGPESAFRDVEDAEAAATSSPGRLDVARAASHERRRAGWRRARAAPSRPRRPRPPPSATRSSCRRPSRTGPGQPRRHRGHDRLARRDDVDAGRRRREARTAPSWPIDADGQDVREARRVVRRIAFVALVAGRRDDERAARRTRRRSRAPRARCASSRRG